MRSLRKTYNNHVAYKGKSISPGELITFIRG